MKDKKNEKSYDYFIWNLIPTILSYLICVRARVCVHLLNIVYKEWSCVYNIVGIPFLFLNGNDDIVLFLPELAAVVLINYSRKRCMWKRYTRYLSDSTRRSDIRYVIKLEENPVHE
jgi:hypothetical protein